MGMLYVHIFICEPIQNLVVEGLHRSSQADLISVCIDATEPVHVSFLPSASTENIRLMIGFLYTIVLTGNDFDPFASVVLFST